MKILKISPLIITITFLALKFFNIEPISKLTWIWCLSPTVIDIAFGAVCAFLANTFFQDDLRNALIIKKKREDFERQLKSDMKKDVPKKIFSDLVTEKMAANKLKNDGRI